MWSYPKFLLILIVTVFAYQKGFGQDSTIDGKTLSWNLEKCIDYANKNNIQINTLRLSQLTSQQQYLMSKAARLPNLSGSASQNFEHAQNGVLSNTGYSTNNSKYIASGAYSLNSSITLYNGNYINNTISQANLTVQSSNLNIIQQENSVSLLVTQAYLAILLDQENIVYYLDILKTTTAQVKQEYQMFKVGSVARYALIQLQAQLSTDNYNLINYQNTLRGDILTLKQLLLLPSYFVFNIIKPDSIKPIDSITPFQKVEQIAFNNRPEIKIGELGVRIAQYDIAKAKAGFKPVLVAGGTLNTSYSSGYGNFQEQLNSNFYQEIGLSLSIPIFSRRQIRTQVEEAKIQVKQAELYLKDSRITLSQSVERAFINVENSKSQYSAAFEEFSLNKETYRIANEQLKVGVANLVDFLLQKNLYIQAQQAYIQAKYNELLSLKIYDFYRGIPIKL